MKRLKQLLHFTLVMTASIGTLLLPACQPAPDYLERIKQRGELIVGTQYGPTTYYQELDQETGFEYELAKAFSHYLGIPLTIRVYRDPSELIQAVHSGEIDLAASGMMVTDERRRALRFTTAYQNTSQYVVYHSSSAKPRTLSDLIGKKLVIQADSNHSDTLQQLKADHPELLWEEKTHTPQLALLNMINDNQADFTIMDGNRFLSYREVFPELKQAFALQEPLPLAWALSREKDPSLFAEAERFLERAKTNGHMALLHSRFFEHQAFDYVGARAFLAHLETRLPLYKEKFQEYAKQLDVDWRLLAAIGYQESMWNPNAISPTGVRGLMMLTRITAKEMGITNRRDPFQSIQGGSRYFKKLYQRLPDDITEPHRTWFALAAYNVGYGHLMDARRLTKQDGQNPNNWYAVKKKLPLLLQEKYFAQTRYGYARSGAQSVIYVKNIKRYYDTLIWATEQKKQRYTPTPQTPFSLTQMALAH